MPTPTGNFLFDRTVVIADIGRGNQNLIFITQAILYLPSNTGATSLQLPHVWAVIRGPRVGER